MRAENCQRCYEPTNGITTMSAFSEEIICMTCKDNERKHPKHKEAVDADIEQIKQGNYNFKGIGFE